MLSCTRSSTTAASRSVVRQAITRPPRRQPVVARRKLATAAGPTTTTTGNPHTSHLAAGLAGGAVTVGALYAYYHISGTAQVVSTTRQTIQAAQSARDKLASATPSASDALGLLRSIARSYASTIPGAAGAVDASFDQLEKLAETHGEKVREVIQQTYQDVQKATEGGAGDAGEKIVQALSAAVGRVQSLVGQEGGAAFDAAFGKLKEKFPDVANVMEGEYQEFSKLADKHGPEASRIASSFYDESASIVSSGGLNAATLERIKKLLDTKTEQVKKLSREAGQDAWAASAKRAQPLLDKAPDVKKMVEENLSKLEGVVGQDKVEYVKSLYTDLETISKSGKSLDDMTRDAQSLLSSRFGSVDFEQLKSSAASSLSSSSDELYNQALKYAASVPGLAGVKDALEGVDLKALANVASQHGEEGQKIIKDTFSEIRDILQKKAVEAKKVGERAAKDAKKEVGK